MRKARIKILEDSQGRLERACGGNAILMRCVLSLERNIGREDEFRVSGGSEFQSRGPMTQKALLPSDRNIHPIRRECSSKSEVRRFPVFAHSGQSYQALNFPLSGYEQVVIYFAGVFVAVTIGIALGVFSGLLLLSMVVCCQRKSGTGKCFGYVHIHL